MNTLYQLLFIDQHTGNISHTKFWSNFGYGISCYILLHLLITKEFDILYWITFGVLVMGNTTANKIMTYKYGKPNDKDEPKERVEPSITVLDQPINPAKSATKMEKRNDSPRKRNPTTTSENPNGQ